MPLSSNLGTRKLVARPITASPVSVSVCTNLATMLLLLDEGWRLRVWVVTRGVYLLGVPPLGVLPSCVVVPTWPPCYCCWFGVEGSGYGVLNSGTTTAHKCAAVPRRARI